MWKYGTALQSVDGRGQLLRQHADGDRPTTNQTRDRRTEHRRRLSSPGRARNGHLQDSNSRAGATRHVAASDRIVR